MGMVDKSIEKLAQVSDRLDEIGKGGGDKGSEDAPTAEGGNEANAQGTSAEPSSEDADETERSRG